MTQLEDAIARYHRILEGDHLKDLGWADAIHERMKSQHLTVAGRPVSPVLRPHFITQRQYTGLTKAAEALYSALDRVEKMALANPALMSRMQMLPAEKMLASVDPGYSYMAVTSLLDTHLNNGTLHFTGYTVDTPLGVVYGEALNNIFYDAPPVKEFRKKYSLSKIGGTKPLVQSLLKAYKEFGGRRTPQIAILEFRQPFQKSDTGEYALLTELFRREGYATEVVSPDQLEYRSGTLCRGNFRIDLIYRRVKISEFLVRFDLSHPLVRAYRDKAVCVVNSFRSELAAKKAIFELLTDESILASFPAAERKAIRDFIPWTRVVRPGRTTYQNESIDLLEWILKNRENLVLRPNDDSTENPAYTGSEMDDAAWDRALKLAARNSYVVQERTKPLRSVFPLHRNGRIEMQEMLVDVQPHSFLGKVQGASSWLTAVGSGFSTVAGLAPTFLLDKN